MSINRFINQSLFQSRACLAVLVTCQLLAQGWSNSTSPGCKHDGIVSNEAIKAQLHQVKDVSVLVQEDIAAK